MCDIIIPSKGNYPRKEREIETMTNEKFFEVFIESAKTAYIQVMGEEKWMSLTDAEKHDVVMALANGMNAVMSE